MKTQFHLNSNYLSIFSLIKKAIMAIENKMFCFQCQETSRNEGCTVKGVCGKEAPVANSMDLLMYALEGISVLSTAIRDNKADYALAGVNAFIIDSLFCTITNANFDEESIKGRITKAIKIKEELLDFCKKNKIEFDDVPQVHWKSTPDKYDEESKIGSVLKEQNIDRRSLTQTVIYGLRGMAAYADHALRLGYTDETIDAFMQRALRDIAVNNLPIEKLIDLVLETGSYGVKVMALLDKANTESYGNPEITEVKIGVSNKPAILISGHDLKDMEELLKQTEGTGVDVYTHSEMLPAHYYPAFKKYKHFIGNYGNAWWKQREEFSTFNGPILFTTNCIVPPLSTANYADKVFTTNATGYPGFKYIETKEDGTKDFSEIIELAKKCPPPTQIEEGSIIGGFAHNQVVKLKDKVVDAVKKGAIKRFVVMGGCDGRMKSRDYYTEFAEKLPNDTVILTAGCAKYRYNKLPLGDIEGIPRVLDAGQCNDSYSLVMIAMALKDAFGLESVNDLPITYNIAWYEQKAVIVFLALLSLGIKKVNVGPTIPAFLSPDVLNVLIDKFGIGTISTVEDDLKAWIA